MIDKNRARPSSAAQPDPEMTRVESESGAAAKTKIIRHRGRQRSPTKLQVTVRLDRDLVAKLKKGGRGWQTRLNDSLRAAILPHTVKPDTRPLTINRVIVDPEE